MKKMHCGGATTISWRTLRGVATLTVAPGDPDLVSEFRGLHTPTESNYIPNDSLITRG